MDHKQLLCHCPRIFDKIGTSSGSVVSVWKWIWSCGEYSQNHTEATNNDEAEEIPQEVLQDIQNSTSENPFPEHSDNWQVML